MAHAERLKEELDEAQRGARAKLGHIQGNALRAGLHLSPGPRKDLTKAVNRSSRWFLVLTQAIETGNQAAIYHHAGELIWLTAALGISMRALPEMKAEMKAEIKRQDIEIARRANCDKATKRREDLEPVVKRVCESLRRKPATTQKFAEKIRPHVLKELGLPKDEKKPTIYKIRQALRAVNRPTLTEATTPKYENTRLRVLKDLGLPEDTVGLTLDQLREAFGVRIQVDSDRTDLK